MGRQVIQRDIGQTSEASQNDGANGIDKHIEELDVLVVGAGFAGIYLTHQLRKQGFTVKIVEAGGNLGGIWYWNRYPGARVDSQYPAYALSLPEVYKDWTWTSHYPDHTELRAYFDHADKKLHIKKDTIFYNKVVEADWNEEKHHWEVSTHRGRVFRARFFIPCVGFAAKRYIPEWDGLETFKGSIFHSSFWPTERVNVSGKRCAVIGSGATGVQITQEWAKEIDETGDLKMFQRTPNMALPMRQAMLTGEEQDKDRDTLPSKFALRDTTYAGYLYQYRPLKTLEQTPQARESLYEELWDLGGQRFLMNNFMDMNRDVEANKHAYNFWRDQIRARVTDPEKAEKLAPTVAPHPFGSKRCSLEQDFYEQFNKPNVDVVDMKNTPIERFTPDGIITADGTLHKLDVIALATGFDSVTGGLKDINIRGTSGQMLADKWKTGTWTYLGITTSDFPNFFFIYGPHAPTAFSNGPTTVELQANWLVDLLVNMRTRGLQKVNASKEAEEGWRRLVHELSAKGLRHYYPSSYNGANIPGKPREPLNYAGGIPLYKQALEDDRHRHYEGFVLQ